MPQLLSSKNLLLSSRPLAVGVVADQDALERLMEMPVSDRDSLCDVVELRLDLLGLSAADLRARLAGNTLPLLLTARHPAEGGQAPEDPVARAAMYEPLLDLAALIDIELRSAQEMSTTIKNAHAAGAFVVGSFHDFQITPSDEVLSGAISYGQPAGVDAVKIATFLQSQEDLIRLMKLAAAPNRQRLSVMGMGPWGRVSRLVLAKCGSLLNYGYIGKANAPGQWPVAELKNLLQQL
ncbi:MAG: type I 3-dehydroquinate dehydratase [Verrucomicrobiaceae bacterium]|nr:type I 3-dehydroquinate dehydratase [Verrucomicrobiaceae bacterium]